MEEQLCLTQVRGKFLSTVSEIVCINFPAERSLICDHLVHSAIIPYAADVSDFALR